LFFVLSAAPRAFAKEQITIRVGYSNSEFLHAGSTNAYTGYGYELLQMIGQYEPIKYEYVYAKPRELSQMLENGEIDLLAPLHKTEELEQKYDFTDLSIGSSQLVIAADGTSDFSERLTTEKLVLGTVVGSMSDSKADRKLLKEYCKKNQIQYALMPYSSYGVLKDNLKLDQIDAVFAERWDVNDYQILARFNTRNMYLAVKKGNTELLEYLNDGLEKLEANSPEYQQQLYDKYYTQHDITGTVLTTEEKEYIKQLDTVNVAVPGNTVPLEYEDSDGNFDGINISILNEISQKTGIEFDYINTDSLNGALNQLKGGKIDIICGVVDNSDWADTHNLVLTTSYMDNVQAVVSSEEKKFINGTAVIAVYNANLTIPDYYHSSYLECSSLEECFNAVKNGEADFTFGNIYAVESLRLKSSFQKFKVSAISESSGAFCFAMEDSDDLTLYHILNKAVKSITSEEIEELVNTASLEKEVEFSLSGYIYDHTMEVIIAIFAIAVLIVGITIWRMKKNTVYEKQLSEKYAVTEQRYQMMMDFTGDNVFQYDQENDTLYCSKSMAENFGIERSYRNFKKFRVMENLIHPEDFKLYEEFLADLLKNHFRDRQIMIRILNKEKEYEKNFLYGCAISNQKGKVTSVMGRLFDENTNIVEKKQKFEFQGIYSYLEIKDIILHMIEESEHREKHVMILMDFRLNGITSESGEENEAVLSRAAGCIHSCVRDTDIVGRAGDSQLLLFMARIQSREQIENKLDRIKRLLREEFYTDDGMKIMMGYAVYPLQGGNYEELYEKALSDITEL
jgi:ABC-type amino acid transport substrate-binding protein/GGDEF domain-containing protein